LNIADSD
jgi:hypothetical protein